MDLVFEDFDEPDVFNLLQVVLTAKFDSGRSDDMMGAPVVDRVLRQLLSFDFKDPFFVKSVAWFREAQADAALVERAAQALEHAKLDWPDEQLENFIRQMLFPYRLTDTELATLKRIARTDRTSL
jgi:hypothetical protein